MKLLYNDEELDLYKFCHGESSPAGTKNCEYELFKERILENTFENMKEECAIPPKEAKVYGLDLTKFLMYLTAVLVCSSLIFLSICCSRKFFNGKKIATEAGKSKAQNPMFRLVES